ncbi:hypothetical protein MPTK1_6g19750 [Marchantia polymorpha subsp. ruderalis]|uniref:Uncharacterized protein n=2 Tax=Marchantia polymorpha TaxID=3197 RepID=A0AAF6BTX5_MARPO|nr:hypothetical protein MARPO_0045s0088 [Marchantia polymorpha]BBN15459.1 hypothetical protein Mp_6g19750 [Marchantia polymorpha subsp. ruderalis]|eukprot:PTQ39429.1 hypothetical protein MARPO_0045s0088 [Marchantia polymorpha]
MPDDFPRHNAGIKSDCGMFYSGGKSFPVHRQSLTLPALLHAVHFFLVYLHSSSIPASSLNRLNRTVTSSF